MKKSIIILILIISFITPSFIHAMPSEKKVCMAYFRSSDCLNCARVDEIISRMQQKYPYLEVKTYDAQKERKLLEEISYLYTSYRDVPMIYIGNTWFYFGSHVNISQQSKRLNETVERIYGLGGCGCPIEDGKVVYPKAVDVIIVYEEGEEINDIGEEIQNAAKYVRIDMVNATEKPSIMERFGLTHTPAFVIGDNIFYNISNATSFIENYSIVGMDFPSGWEEKKICILYFYSPSCSYCHIMDERLKELAIRYPIIMKKYNILIPKNDEMMQSYFDKYNISMEKRHIPAIFLNGKYFNTERDLPALEEEIKKWIGVGLPCDVPPNYSAEKTIKGMNFFTVIFAGLADGINPCAFATLIFFISYLERTKKKAMIPVGMAFITGIFISYLMIGFGIMQFLYASSSIKWFSRYLDIAIGVAALVLSIFSLNDAFLIRKGKKPVLQTPRFLKAKRGRFIKKITEDRKILLLAAISFLTAFAISAIEFICTGQILLPTMAVITSSSSLKSIAIMYLIIYNIMFIIPLTIILILFYYGYSSMQIAEKHENKYFISKIVIAFILAIMGAYLIYLNV
ncbi:MAG: hypothetical protein J7K61_01460 [Thermoplasmata archaeon]|nr:hypothetical protein [Thermoplasmata archaeon]